RELVGVQAQNVLQRGRDTGPALRRQRLESLVESGPAAQDAGRELVSQSPVGLGKRPQGLIQSCIERTARAYLLENGQRRSARGKTIVSWHCDKKFSPRNRG